MEGSFSFPNVDEGGTLFTCDFVKCFSEELPSETMTMLVARIANGFKTTTHERSLKDCKCYFIGNLAQHVQYILDF